MPANDQTYSPMSTRNETLAEYVEHLDENHPARKEYAALIAQPQPTLAGDVDGERWRALLASPRISIIGSAGFGHGHREPDADGYRHMTLNFWSKHQDHPTNDESNKFCQETLIDYTDVLIAAAKGG